MELYIIRHAQSKNNAIWAQTGSEDGRHSDPELTEIGLRQAELVAQRVAMKETAVSPPTPDFVNRNGFNLTHLYASLQTRAVQTGTAISKATGVPLVAWEIVHEWGGIYDTDVETKKNTGLPGPNRDYFTERFPEFMLPDTLGKEGWWNRPHEERPQTVERVRRFYSELLERHGKTDDRVGIVTHGGFTAVFLLLLTESFTDENDTRLEKHVWFAHNNTGITRINFSGDYIQLAYMNDINHLPAELIT